MIRFAAKGTAFEALEPNLEGPTALAVSQRGCYSSGKNFS